MVPQKSFKNRERIGKNLDRNLDCIRRNIETLQKYALTFIEAIMLVAIGKSDSRLCFLHLSDIVKIDLLIPGIEYHQRSVFATDNMIKALPYVIHSVRNVHSFVAECANLVRQIISGKRIKFRLQLIEFSDFLNGMPAIYAKGLDADAKATYTGIIGRTGTGIIDSREILTEKILRNPVIQIRRSTFGE